MYINCTKQHWHKTELSQDSTGTNQNLVNDKPVLIQTSTGTNQNLVNDKPVLIQSLSQFDLGKVQVRTKVS